MVIKRVRRDDLITLAKKYNIPDGLINEMVNEASEMDESRKWIPREPAPIGGISIREAERKYNFSHSTIYSWVKKGYLPVIKDTKWEKFVDESKLVELINAYNTNPGRGTWAVKRLFNT